MAQQKQIRLGTMRLWFQSLASLGGLRIQCCHKLWYRSQTGLDLALVWLWCRPVAVAPIRSLAWKLPYVMSAALKRQKTKNKTKQNKTLSSIFKNF